MIRNISFVMVSDIYFNITVYTALEAGDLQFVLQIIAKDVVVYVT